MANNNIWKNHLESSNEALSSYIEYLEEYKDLLYIRRAKNWEDELRRQGELDCIDKQLAFLTMDKRDNKAYQEYQYLKDGK